MRENAVFLMMVAHDVARNSYFSRVWILTPYMSLCLTLKNYLGHCKKKIVVLWMATQKPDDPELY